MEVQVDACSLDFWMACREPKARGSVTYAALLLARYKHCEQQNQAVVVSTLDISILPDTHMRQDFFSHAKVEAMLSYQLYCQLLSSGLHWEVLKLSSQVESFWAWLISAKSSGGSVNHGTGNTSTRVWRLGCRAIETTTKEPK